jgi:hypothetical protein
VSRADFHSSHIWKPTRRMLLPFEALRRRKVVPWGIELSVPEPATHSTWRWTNFGCRTPSAKNWLQSLLADLGQPPLPRRDSLCILLIGECNVMRNVNSDVFSNSEGLETKLECAAHHEAGHIVIAAVQSLKLRAEGLIVDAAGEGLACYFKEPEENDLSRERVAIASFAGFKAEKRLRQGRSYSPLYELGITLSPDWVHARKSISKLSPDYPLGGDPEMIRIKLESVSECLVEGNWATIQGLAAAVLARDLMPLQPLKSTTQWSDETMARYLTGEEVVRVLREHLI